MSETTHRIQIGAYGWSHAAWQDDFYPHELPEDWQLGYYGNEFPVIMVPAAYWQQPGPAQIEAALEDCAESLQVVYEAPLVLQADTPVAEAVSLVHDLVEQIGALAQPCAALSIPADSADFPFGEFLQVLDVSIPVVFCFATGLADTQASHLYPLFKEYAVGLCWTGGAGEEALQFGPVALTIIRGPLEMRRLRGVIETILATTSQEQHSILIFQDEPPDIQSMRNAAVMLDLF